MSPSVRRASAHDWTGAGLALLRDEGLNALTVDRLCALLGKSKGSFYHHFVDLDAFLSTLLARWEEDQTEAPIREAGLESDPRRRVGRLDRAVRALDHRLDGAVRAWALWDLRAQAAMERVDQRRVQYLEELWRLGGHLQPRLLAELEYVTFVGAQQLGLFAAPSRAARLSVALRRALELLAAAEDPERPRPKRARPKRPKAPPTPSTGDRGP